MDEYNENIIIKLFEDIIDFKEVNDYIYSEPISLIDDNTRSSILLNAIGFVFLRNKLFSYGSVRMEKQDLFNAIVTYNTTILKRCDHILNNFMFSSSYLKLFEILNSDLRVKDKFIFLNRFGDFEKIENIANFMEEKSKYTNFLKSLSQKQNENPIKNFLITFFSLDVMKMIVNLDFSINSFHYFKLDISRNTRDDFLKEKNEKLYKLGSKFTKWLKREDYPRF